MPMSLKYPSRLVLNANRARQARLGRPVLWVLLFSTALAALALFGAWSASAPKLAASEPTAQSQTQNARHFDTGDAAVQQTSPPAN
jgi:hypothetical protein